MFYNTLIICDVEFIWLGPMCMYCFVGMCVELIYKVNYFLSWVLHFHTELRLKEYFWNSSVF